MTLEAIGRVGYRVEYPGPTGSKFSSIGKLYVDGKKAWLFLTQFYCGDCVCKPDEGKPTPYIHGDLIVWEDFKPNSFKRYHSWCGFVYSSDTDKGVVYHIVLRSFPLLSIARMKPGSRGMKIPIWQEEDNGKA